jgi:NhaA family Na+:H+ antiporter
VVTPRKLLIRPIEAFVSIEGSGGIALLAATVAAVAWVNSPWGQSYHDVWGWSHGVDFATLHRNVSVHAFVNDGLMAIFFYMVGLEIKRELVEGELNTPRRAALPAIAALGGMVVPALIYFGLNAGSEGAHGWGIPMATDIAFAIGVMTLVGTRVPFPLKVFLLGLAIVDDLGAIIVIAVFYTSSINVEALGLGIACLVFVALALRAGLQQWPLYLVLGVGAWLAVLESGVHATIAGVALGFLTSSKPVPGRESALDRTESRIHPWVSYLVIPVFAVANAGVEVSGSALHAAVTSEIALGIGLGLVVGKPLGIFLAAWLAVRAHIADLPEAIGWSHIAGAGLLGGIGFTVSLFITALAFDTPVLIDDAKIGIFTGSIVSGLLGLAWLWFVARPAAPDEQSVS